MENKINDNIQNLDHYIGLFFEAKREYTDHFAFFLKPFDICKYDWYVDCSENFISNEGNVGLFLPDGLYSGEEFKKICFSNAEYFLHLIRLFAVPAGLPFDQKTIDAYEDYIKSNAIAAFLSADSYISFYVKDKRLLRECFSACADYLGDAGKVSLTSVENDDRTGFWV